jgi:uridine phosphorylase
MARSYAALAMPVHLHPTATLAPRALLPGDPGRAMLLAQLLTSEPKMFNHNRGLWGYTGIAPDGEPLTIQSTGMGGPSAAIVLEELCDLGLRRAIRVGTCGALVDDLAHGDLVVADVALAFDGTSRALGADGRVAADAGLVEALVAAAGGRAPSRRATSSTSPRPRALARGYGRAGWRSRWRRRRCCASASCAGCASRAC